MKNNEQEVLESLLKQIKENGDLLSVKVLVRYLFPTNKAAQGITNTQAYIVRLIGFSEVRRINLSAFTRYGKTQMVAIGVAIYILINENKKIIFMGPTDDQASIIKNYMSSLLLDCPILLEIADIQLTDKINRLKAEASQRRMTFKNLCEYRVVTAHGKGFSAMGFGGDLVIMDEAAMVSRESYAKIMRMLGDDAANAIFIEMFNPWDRNTKAYEHSISDRYLRIEIDYRIGLKEKRITKDFVEEMREDMSPMEFTVLYESKFPEETDDQLIKGKDIDNALRAIPANLPENDVLKILGVDLARYGTDKTVLTYIKLYSGSLAIIQEIRDYFHQDTMKTTGQIVNWDNQEHFHKIIVDDTGLGGGVVDRLIEQDQTANKTIPFIAGKSPSEEVDKKRFLNFKAMYYNNLRRFFESGNILLIDNLDLINELAQIKQEYHSTGRMQIIKAEKGEKSPDFCFDANTLVRTKFGQKPIKDIKIGEFVKTPFGNRKVIDKSTRYVEDILELKLSNNTKIITTPGHKFFNGKVFKHAITLNNQDKLNNNSRIFKLKWKLIKLLCTTERDIGFRQLIQDIITPIYMKMEKGERLDYIDKFGKISTKEKYQMGLLSTTKMKIRLIIIQKILNLLNEENIKENTCLINSETHHSKEIMSNNLKKLGKKLKNGINLKKEENGTKNIILSLLKSLKHISTSVLYVIKNIILHELNILNTVLINVGLKEITIEAIESKKKKTKVYNITVEKDHVYFANDILVSNSDSLMMAVSNLNKTGFAFEFMK